MLKRIGRYFNLKSIDSGGMGQVFLAEHEILPGTFVVKVLHPAMQADPEAIERFKRECIILSRIQHPNIVHCLEPGEEAGTWYLPMEWVRGETLQKKIEGTDPAPLPDKVAWALQILSGLEAAHTARPRPVIHRDLKPSNIMVTEEGVVKILDFGIAHEAGSKLTRVSNPGTPEFQAPEQLKNGALDARTDLFSLGIVLYMLFAGRHPFKRRPDQSEFETQSAIVSQDPEPLTDLDPRLPPRLSEIVLKALSKKSEDRFASAQEMRRALETLHHKEGKAEDEKLEFARRQVERAMQLCDAGGAESLDEAARFASNALALLPDFSEALLLRERIRSLRSEIERIEVLYSKARRAIEERQYREARSCLDLALSIRPSDSRLRRLEAELRATETEGERPAGGAPAGAAGSAPGEAIDPRLPEAVALAAGGRRAEAERLFDDLLLGRPGDLRVLAAAWDAGCVPAAGRTFAWSEGVALGSSELDRLERDLALAESAWRAGPPGAEVLASCLERWHAHLDSAALSAPPAGRPVALRDRLGRIEAAARRPGGAVASREILRAWEAG
jgi:serine/threonine-protein kinase